MMIKRPQFADNEEKLADAEETLDSHKTHHHLPKGHASRHHKKHDKTAHTTADRDTTTESVAKIGTTLSNERVSTVEGKLDKYSTTPVETFIAETVVETSTTTISSTIKPKKTPRRQKIKETSANRTEIEEDKPQRRRKVHHHRKNNTLLTNSVHDDVPRANTTDISDVASSTTARDPTTHERHTYGRQKFTTVPTIIAETSTARREIIDVSRTSSNFNQDHTTESIAVTESGTIITTMTSIHTTENVPRTSATIAKGSSPNRSRNTSLTVPTTTPLPRKYSKIQRNRTSGTLGPARIDVTILEAPDRKHKQGKIANKIFQIIN